MMKQEYKQLIQAKGHLPTGFLSKDFSVNFISNFLERSLDFNESLSDITGVRRQGKNAFLMLTSKRLICVSAHSESSFEVILDLKYQNIQKLFVAPLSGIRITEENIGLSLYFVQSEAGQKFSESFQSLGINVESLETFPADKYEKRLVLPGIIGFLAIIALFGSCVYRSVTNVESSNTGVDAEAIEACLRKYIKGDTVEAHEIEEAHSRCAP
jgi:hypothetical protein